MLSTDMVTRHRSVAAIVCLISMLMLGGCVSQPAMTYQASIDNTEVLLAHPTGKLSVGSVDAAAGVANRHLSIRGSELTGGPDGTFAGYLRDALMTELKAAGRLDPASTTRIDGTLTHNELDGGAVKNAKAVLGARFIVTKDGETVYDKTLTATHQWESSFIGAIAIPAAFQNYPAAMQKLVAKLFNDPEFIQAADMAPATAAAR
ncbi:MAG TPA: hypothetical protein VIM98_07865 [Dyella sp.]|uniref:hypothetical protein n=1 Tax=Dyella sp. TaxID=1869338 RepID=UPI002F91D164